MYFFAVKLTEVGKAVTLVSCNLGFCVQILFRTPGCPDIYCSFLQFPQEMPGQYCKLNHNLFFPHPFKLTIHRYPVTVCCILWVSVCLPVSTDERQLLKSFDALILQQCERGSGSNNTVCSDPNWFTHPFACGWRNWFCRINGCYGYTGWCWFRQGPYTSLFSCYRVAWTLVSMYSVLGNWIERKLAL